MVTNLAKYDMLWQIIWHAVFNSTYCAFYVSSFPPPTHTHTFLWCREIFWCFVSVWMNRQADGCHKIFLSEFCLSFSLSLWWKCPTKLTWAYYQQYHIGLVQFKLLPLSPSTGMCRKQGGCVGGSCLSWK